MNTFTRQRAARLALPALAAALAGAIITSAAAAPAAPGAAATPAAAATTGAPATTVAPASGAAPAPGDPVHGKTIYEVCTGCHSPDENDVGPKHRGVVGRTAGTIADYPYSAALKKSGVVWDPSTLDRWLTNLQSVVPGTKMFFALNNARDRADVISYLQTLK